LPTATVLVVSNVQQPQRTHELNRRMQLAYDGIAELYASRNAHLPDIYVELGLRFLALARPGCDVLDAGCGVGRDLAWLESQGCHMIGIDLSRGMLRLARGVTASALVQRDLWHLSFTSNQLGGVWCSASLLHLPRADSRSALQELRRVGAWLDQHRDSWAGRQFWIRGRRVYWDDDLGQRVGTAHPLQSEMRIEMDAVTQDMQDAIATLRKRDPAQVGQVERRRYTMGHEPIIAGTRIPTRAIWQLHQAGYSRKAIRTEFPRLTDRDIAAALEAEEHRRAS